MVDHRDFSVVAKVRAGGALKPWKWEIYRAGRRSPIKTSVVYFQTVSEAQRAGKGALQLLLSEVQD